LLLLVAVLVEPINQVLGVLVAAEQVVLELLQACQ
jgi:hypothetical protein